MVGSNLRDLRSRGRGGRAPTEPGSVSGPAGGKRTSATRVRPGRRSSASCRLVVASPSRPTRGSIGSITTGRSAVRASRLAEREPAAGQAGRCRSLFLWRRPWEVREPSPCGGAAGEGREARPVEGLPERAVRSLPSYRDRAQRPPRATPAPTDACDPNYSGCVPRVAYDLGSADIEGPVRVIGVDIHRFEGDGDGRGCEWAQSTPARCRTPSWNGAKTSRVEKRPTALLHGVDPLLTRGQRVLLDGVELGLRGRHPSSRRPLAFSISAAAQPSPATDLMYASIACCCD